MFLLRVFGPGVGRREEERGEEEEGAVTSSPISSSPSRFVVSLLMRL